jgi:ferritin-like metal-binding protein YciE
MQHHFNYSGKETSMHSLEHLYYEELRDLVSAETQLIAALPKMAKGAKSSELRSAIETHLAQTREHKSRLEKILKAHGEKTTGKHCKGMEGLIAEGSDLLKEEGDPAVKDAAIIAAAQRVEHYEIAGYGSARTFASKLGFMDDKVLLQQTLDEEGQTDLGLTRLAQGEHGEDGINAKARGTGLSTEKSMAKKNSVKSTNGVREKTRS